MNQESESIGYRIVAQSLQKSSIFKSKRRQAKDYKQIRGMSSPTHLTDSDEFNSLAIPFLPYKMEPVKLQATSKTAEEMRDPTEKQLCQCILMIKDRFPLCKLDRVILLLHHALAEDELKDSSSHTQTRRNYLLEDDFLSDDSISEIEKKKMQQEYARKFQNSEANPRFYEQREIAKLFCLKGYGYPTAREYLGDSITPNRYNNVITTIVRLSYRKLEYYIIKYLQPRLPMISREELKMIKTPLVNCRNWMNERQADNFHRFVKMTYKIHTPEPEREIVMDLHEKIMQQLKHRNVTYRPHRRGGDPNAWSPDMDAHLISNYLSHPNPNELQRQLTSLFPTNRACFELGRLRLRLERLLRLALRKVYADRDKFGLNEPQTLSEYLVCKISRSMGAIDVRKRLLSYYLDSDTNAMKLRWVRQVIDDFVKASRFEVEEIEDSSCEVVAKEELKAEASNTERVKEKEESQSEKENERPNQDDPEQSSYNYEDRDGEVSEKNKQEQG